MIPNAGLLDRNYVKAHPEAEVYEVFWALYKEIVRLGAENFSPFLRIQDTNMAHLCPGRSTSQF